MSSSQQRQILCLWLPNWPIQRVLAAEPTLVGRPVILETRDARRGLLVAGANLAARRAGARVGMRMSELAALKPVDDTSDWDVRSYDPAADLDALCDLVEQAQQFSPVVGLEQLQAQPWHGRHHLQPQALLLDATGIANLFGDAAAYLDEVSQWLRSQRYFAYMALASTVGAAWALANYEVLRRIKQESATAADASDVPGKADREPIDLLTYVPDSRSVIAEPWEEAELLSSLPVGCLRVPTETVDKLRRLGVGILNQLWQLPRDGLASRLGTELMHRSDQALGLAEEAVIALHAAPDWTCEMSLEHPTLSVEVLATALEQMCRELCERMNRAGQGTLRCLCRLDMVRRPPLLMQLGLYRACDDAAHLHRLLSGQLEQVLNQASNDEGDRFQKLTTSFRQKARQAADTARPKVMDEEGTVWRISLQATMIGPMQWQQTQLFDQSEQRTRQQLAGLIDTLSSRLGREQVLEARVERDAEPDQAVSYQPLTGRRLDGQPQQTSRKLNSRLATHSAEPRPTDPLRRPIHLLIPPEMLAAVSLDTDERLVEFVYDQRRVRVISHWGPERLESGWWRGPSMRRDYYRIETNDGAWWWIYRDLAKGHWFVHGLFG